VTQLKTLQQVKHSVDRAL